MSDVSTIETPRVSVPALGFGTSELSSDEVSRTVPAALDAGYRHLDTAQAYRNEEAVGAALAANPVARDEVFVTTKVWRDHAAPEDVERTTAESLDRLGLDHLDLLLLHWPADDIAPMQATLEALDRVRERGMTRHIGVSNFPSALLRRAHDVAPIVTNQVEHHPYLAVGSVLEVLTANDAFLTAYCPIAQGEVLDDPTLNEIGEAHGVNAVQVTLRWHLQRGVCAIPRTSDPQRVADNFDVFGFELSDAEVARIDGLAEGRRLIDPPFAPAWDVA